MSGGVVNKLKLIADICADTRLSPAQRVVGIAMLSRFHNTTSGACFPSYQQIAEASGVDSKSTARRATHKMRKLGYLTFTESNGGRNHRNSYVFETVAPAARFEGVTPLNGSTSGPPGYHQRHETVAPAAPHIPSELPSESTLEGKIKNGPAEKERGETSVNDDFYGKRISDCMAELKTEQDPERREELEAKIVRCREKLHGKAPEPFPELPAFLDRRSTAERAA